MKIAYVCSRPFDWLEIHDDGSAFVCCPAWLRRPVGNLLTTPWRQVWNGAVAVELRKTVINGTLHNCSARRCPFLAAITSPVAVADQCDDAHLLEDIRQKNTCLKHGPNTLNLSFDPRCNLTCPSCRHQPPVLDDSALARIDCLVRLVGDELAPDVEELRLSGHGDPFAAAGYRQILNQVSATTFPRLQRLHLHSNGLLWTPQRWVELAHLHSYLTSAEISIDAADVTVYAENRGGDFNLLLENLAFIQSLSIDLLLSCVVQLNNYHQMSDFVHLARRFGARSYFSPLINWGTWSRAEYQRRAVHLSEHPDHQAFCEALAQVATLPDVDVGALSVVLA
ncbi:SPASM domain-containing protein [Desulfuromonas acetoxidans]|uniref:Radical SAM n=1 Tax=Desulfuromonas acetoxidans (strain DSM 684 / 11070) TaxID=281689 RepID=Q1K109_DESA6|nr:SPASM domain-containing protein [Desulfuromonas acetoxidans]EAT16199.1 Radical SAM [Desulfuromonas acetoxidans DSM 684]MBF0645227.1 SPASM domain-containing protein [Desulfuromonas acetoxidans]NVD23029.1 SPASM domain-containing protein [Desulfuromonas acetoxidans]NVE15730.1 SPASM domain-containing protein [Desulfuromonas acetoxidans]